MWFSMVLSLWASYELLCVLCPFILPQPSFAWGTFSLQEEKCWYNRFIKYFQLFPDFGLIASAAFWPPTMAYFSKPLSFLRQQGFFAFTDYLVYKNVSYNINSCNWFWFGCSNFYFFLRNKGHWTTSELGLSNKNQLWGLFCLSSWRRLVFKLVLWMFSKILLIKYFMEDL